MVVLSSTTNILGKKNEMPTINTTSTKSHERMRLIHFMFTEFLWYKIIVGKINANQPGFAKVLDKPVKEVLYKPDYSLQKLGDLVEDLLN